MEDHNCIFLRVDEQGETILLRHHEAVEEANTGLPSESRPVACDAVSGTDHASDRLSVRSTCSDEASGTDYRSDISPVISTCSDEASDTDHTSDTLSVRSTCSNEAAVGSVVSTARGVNDLEELYIDNDKGEVMSTAEHQQINLLDGSSNSSSFAVPNFMTHELAIAALHSDNRDLNGEMAYVSLPSIHRESHQDHPCSGTSSPKGDKSDIAYDLVSSISRENHQDHSCSDSSSPEDHKSWTIQEFELSVYEEKLDSVSSGAMPDKVVSSIVSGCGKPGSTDSLASSVEPLIFGTYMDDTLNNSYPTTITSRSGQLISIDFLEEFISDAKNYKVSFNIIYLLNLRMC